MIMFRPTKGDTVKYHGSETDCHGTYTVTYAPEESKSRGFFLKGMTDSGEFQTLYNVSIKSITLLSTGDGGTYPVT